MNWRALLFFFAMTGTAVAEPVVIGSKAFAESFILAEAGLLDDHACTTFPEDLRTFVEAFPRSSDLPPASAK